MSNRADRRAWPIACLGLLAALPAQETKLAPERALAAHLESFGTSKDPGERSRLFDQMVDLGQPGARAVLDAVEQWLGPARRQYVEDLKGWFPDAYTERLIGLDDLEVLSIQRARRLWKSYVLHGGHRSNFQAEFLAPMKEALQLVLPMPIEQVGSQELKQQRQKLMEFGEYQRLARIELDIDPDPTSGKKSPTGIDYPPLDQPPTFADSLYHTERSLALAHTIAPHGARPVLEYNDQAAQQIDVQEAEYVLFGNEMRLLAGTIAWQVDPLGNAVARDHSNDRTEGLAKGHMSSIKEKHGFTDRSRRMGASRFGSEGVGGGRDGRGYIHGLSYGGGHTGPLYSLKRNVVGVGRRAGAYTSIYRTDRSLVHECQAVADELAMPPGFTRAHLKGAARSTFGKIKAGQFGKAFKAIEKAKAKDDEMAMQLRFLRAAITAEVEWELEAFGAIMASGDVFEAHRRLELGKRAFSGIEQFEKAAEAELEQLESEQYAAEMKAGAAFHKIAQGKLSKAECAKAVKVFDTRHAGTTYAAATRMLDSDKGPFKLFLTNHPNVEKFDYPPKAAR